MGNEEKRMWRDMADKLETLRPKTKIAFYKNTAKEFSTPFNFTSDLRVPFMSRVECRQMVRKAYKVAKKKPRLM